MRLWMLGSGSRGNAVLLESGASRILIDAGFPASILTSRLRAIGIAPQSISHCVITHEHTDHVRGATTAAEKWGWTLHASRGTMIGAPELLAAGTRHFSAGDTLDLDGFSVKTVRTPHDAHESVAIVATAVCLRNARRRLLRPRTHHVRRALGPRRRVDARARGEPRRRHAARRPVPAVGVQPQSLGASGISAIAQPRRSRATSRRSR